MPDTHPLPDGSSACVPARPAVVTREATVVASRSPLARRPRTRTPPSASSTSQPPSTTQPSTAPTATARPLCLRQQTPHATCCWARSKPGSGIHLADAKKLPLSKVILSVNEPPCPAASRRDAPESRVLALERMRATSRLCALLHRACRVEHLLRPPAYRLEALSEAVAMGRTRESQS